MLIKDALKLQNGSYILEKLFKKDKAWLFLNDTLEVPKEFFEIYKKIEEGYPIEYIFEEVEFYGKKYYVKEGVLIPRDDTEVIVEKTIEVINKKFKVPSSKLKVKSENLKVVDCCTGSGVIAITLKSIFKNIEVIATDISDIALEVAKKNALLHNVDIIFKKCDLFNEKGDILVANPPYVEDSYKKPNEYEPSKAFYGGADGLDVVKRVILKAKELDYKIAIIEIGYNQKESLTKFLKEKNIKNFEFFNDLAGNVRGVVIQLKIENR